MAKHWIADIERDFFALLLVYMASYVIIWIAQGINI
jgi:hypothetical protein